MKKRIFLVSFAQGRKTVHKAYCVVGLLILSAVPSARAQNPQFLPEVDAHLKLDSNFRTYLEAKDDRDGGDPTQFTIGPSIQLFLKPLIKLKELTVFDLDDAKSRAVVLEAGYRYITAPNTAPQNRELVAATLNFPLKAGFRVSDRNRADLDWKSGVFTWRYRNKLTLERTFAIRSYHFVPYLAAEPFYESQYSKWSTTDLYAGGLFPINRRFQFNLYYEHENDTGKKPNRQQNYVGLALYMYFALPGQ
jgi:hypothetical protein